MSPNSKISSLEVRSLEGEKYQRNKNIARPFGWKERMIQMISKMSLTGAMREKIGQFPQKKKIIINVLLKKFVIGLYK